MSPNVYLFTPKHLILKIYIFILILFIINRIGDSLIVKDISTFILELSNPKLSNVSLNESSPESSIKLNSISVTSLILLSPNKLSLNTAAANTVFDTVGNSGKPKLLNPVTSPCLKINLFLICFLFNSWC